MQKIWIASHHPACKRMDGNEPGAKVLTRQDRDPRNSSHLNRLIGGPARFCWVWWNSTNFWGA